MSHIHLKNVCKSYRMGNNLIHALNNLSVEIEQGEFVVVLGPSGSGKTTFLNILGGLEHADSGEILVGGEAVNQMNEATLTTLENVALTAEMAQDGYDPQAIPEKVKLGDRVGDDGEAKKTGLMKRSALSFFFLSIFTVAVIFQIKREAAWSFDLLLRYSPWPLVKMRQGM